MQISNDISVDLMECIGTVEMPVEENKMTLVMTMYDTFQACCG